MTALALIIFGVITRYLLRDLPNIETLTVVTLLAGSLLGARWAMVVGLSVIAMTDMLIGNTNILLYTWSAWALLGGLGLILRRHNSQSLTRALELTGLGIVSNLAFFVWTNFGVWQLSGMYAQTINGVVQSYVMGIPFLKLQLLSTLLFVPIVSYIALKLWNRVPSETRVAIPRRLTSNI
jgi:hypothetical protein